MSVAFTEAQREPERLCMYVCVRASSLLIGVEALRQERKHKFEQVKQREKVAMKKRVVVMIHAHDKHKHLVREQHDEANTRLQIELKQRRDEYKRM